MITRVRKLFSIGIPLWISVGLGIVLCALWFGVQYLEQGATSSTKKAEPKNSNHASLCSETLPGKHYEYVKPVILYEICKEDPNLQDLKAQIDQEAARWISKQAITQYNVYYRELGKAHWIECQPQNLIESGIFESLFLQTACLRATMFDASFDKSHPEMRSFCEDGRPGESDTTHAQFTQALSLIPSHITAELQQILRLPQDAFLKHRVSARTFGKLVALNYQGLYLGVPKSQNVLERFCSGAETCRRSSQIETPAGILIQHVAFQPEGRQPYVWIYSAEGKPDAVKAFLKHVEQVIAGFKPKGR